MNVPHQTNEGAVECTCCTICRTQISNLIAEIRDLKKTSLSRFNELHDQSKKIADILEQKRRMADRAADYVRSLVEAGDVKLEVRVEDGCCDD